MDVLAALADPVRRDVLVMLRGAPMTAGAIAAAFPISRPAVSRHLRVLRESGLVVDETVGRERVYRLDVRPLAALDAWLAPFRGGWGAHLDALETEVHRTRRERCGAPPTATPAATPASTATTTLASTATTTLASTPTDIEERSA